MMMKKLFLTWCSLVSLVTISFAQPKHPFANDVNTIKSYDKIYETQPNAILFVGSSSIRKWTHLQAAFGAYQVLNRGIGGAVIDDITYFANDLIFAYQPRQIVLYVGENDLPNAGETADTILQKTKTLFETIRAKLPNVPIVYISMKPSPSRDQFQQKCVQANALIRSYLATQANTSYVDVFTPMLKNGKSRPELFVGDRLHMKPEGYALWEKAVQPYLKK
jgi:lysophospholipase L1-like esterase